MRLSLLFIFLFVPTAASALLLDCDKNSDQTYTCVEVAGEAATATGPQAAPPDQEAMAYARSVCVEERPRRRASNMGSSSAVMMEARKRARTAYEQCLSKQVKNFKNSP